MEARTLKALCDLSCNSAEKETTPVRNRQSWRRTFAVTRQGPTQSGFRGNPGSQCGVVHPQEMLHYNVSAQDSCLSNFWHLFQAMQQMLLASYGTGGLMDPSLRSVTVGHQF